MVLDFFVNVVRFLVINGIFSFGFFLFLYFVDLVVRDGIRGGMCWIRNNFRLRDN